MNPIHLSLVKQRLVENLTYIQETLDPGEWSRKQTEVREDLRQQVIALLVAMNDGKQLQQAMQDLRFLPAEAIPAFFQECYRVTTQHGLDHLKRLLTEWYIDSSRREPFRQAALEALTYITDEAAELAAHALMEMKDTPPALLRLLPDRRIPFKQRLAIAKHFAEQGDLNAVEPLLKFMDSEFAPERRDDFLSLAKLFSNFNGGAARELFMRIRGTKNDDLRGVYYLAFGYQGIEGARVLSMEGSPEEWESVKCLQRLLDSSRDRMSLRVWLDWIKRPLPIYLREELLDAINREPFIDNQEVRRALEDLGKSLPDRETPPSTPEEEVQEKLSKYLEGDNSVRRDLERAGGTTLVRALPKLESPGTDIGQFRRLVDLIVRLRGEAADDAHRHLVQKYRKLHDEEQQEAILRGFQRPSPAVRELLADVYLHTSSRKLRRTAGDTYKRLWPDMPIPSHK
ncbi:MAG: hypothetical protein ABIN58_02360 [candidate division WOR-3 bacterium]